VVGYSGAAKSETLVSGSYPCAMNPHMSVIFLRYGSSDFSVQGSRVWYWKPGVFAPDDLQPAMPSNNSTVIFMNPNLTIAIICRTTYRRIVRLTSIFFSIQQLRKVGLTAVLEVVPNGRSAFRLRPTAKAKVHGAEIGVWTATCQTLCAPQRRT
jgi:hypothetical protein